jgi:dienelactone hydrolase
MVLAGTCTGVLVGRDGTAAWQALRVAIVVACTLGVLRVTATRGGVGAWAGLGFGIVVMVIGAGFLPHLVKDGASLAGVAALGALAGGLVTTVSSTGDIVRGHHAATRILGVVGVVVLTVLVAWVSVPGIAATNVPRPEIGATPAAHDLEFERVTLRTPDGVALAAWYVPSTNGAAIIALHGAGSTRSDLIDHAAVLADHGFGVLLVDARGHGESGGRAMDFGWNGDDDIAAATRFLARRPGVEQIGALGLSMGGEEAIGATASNPEIRAVVAEGATGRTAADHRWLSDRYGIRGSIEEQLAGIRTRLTDALTSAPVPTSLRDAVRRSRARYLLITAGDVEDERAAARYIAADAPRRVTRWQVPGAGHTGGIETHPRAWERRVIAFFDAALGPAEPDRTGPGGGRRFERPTPRT